MSLASVLVGLGLFWLSLAVIGQPFRRRAGNPGSPVEPGYSDGARGVAVAGADAPALEARRDALYGALTDLDFDRSVGKLNEDDYAALRSQLMAQAVDLRRRLDQAANVESQVEALVQARRKATTSRGSRGLVGAMNVYCTACGAALKLDDHFCARCGQPVAANCPQCGAVVAAGDAFCVRCGTALAPREEP